MILGPPKSRAGVRTVSIPAVIMPDLVVHLAKYTGPGSDALIFTGIKGGPMRRSGFNKLTGWPHVVRGMGLPGVHFHDLRHNREHARGGHGRLAAEPHGPDGSRQRARGADLPAQVSKR